MAKTVLITDCSAEMGRACLLPGNTLLIANVGHIQRDRNGRALDLAGSLPMGLDANAAYEVH